MKNGPRKLLTRDEMTAIKKAVSERASVSEFCRESGLNQDTLRYLLVWKRCSLRTYIKIKKTVQL